MVSSYAQGQGQGHVRGQIKPQIVLLINSEANLMELHIKIKHNEKVCCAHDLGSYA